jgi:integrase/recombinase XerD
MNKIEKEMQGFSRYLGGKGFTLNSIRLYLSGVEMFMRNNRKAEQCTYKQVLDYFEELALRQVSIAMRQNMLMQIKKYFDYLLETGRREDHPCPMLNIAGRKNKGVIHTDLFTSAELDLLLDIEAMAPRFKLKNQAMASLLIYQGAMPGEIARMKVSDIDLDAGTVFITGGRVLTSRKLELRPNQYRIMDKYLSEAREQIRMHDMEHLIINFHGKPMQVYDFNYFTGLCKALFPGRNLTTKTIRDSVISNWLNENKIPLDQVQLMAGHRWISCTQRYEETSIEEQREMLRKFHPLG